jgi:hypothetical protein
MNNTPLYVINGGFTDLPNMVTTYETSEGSWFGYNIPNEWTTAVSKKEPLSPCVVYYNIEDMKYYANMHVLSKGGEDFIPFVQKVPVVPYNFNLKLEFYAKNPFNNPFGSSDWALLYDVTNTSISGRVTAENAGKITVQENNIPANTPISIRFWKEKHEDIIGLTDVSLTIDVPTSNQ